MVEMSPSRHPGKFFGVELVRLIHSMKLKMSEKLSCPPPEELMPQNHAQSSLSCPPLEDMMQPERVEYCLKSEFLTLRMVMQEAAMIVLPFALMVNLKL